MEKVKIGDFKVGDNLFIDYGEDNPNNKEVQVRAIVDMEIVILLDVNQNYLLYNCPFLIWIWIEVCFCLTFGVIVRDHYVLLCVVAEFKFVHNKI